MYSSRLLSIALALLLALWLGLSLVQRQASGTIAGAESPMQQFLPILPQTVPQFNVSTELFAFGLSQPVGIANAGDERLFIVQQSGKIHILTGTGQLLAQPFLDLTGQVGSGFNQGLLGLTFDPDYATNGRFYVFYTDLNNDSRIARYLVSADPNVAQADSESIILNIDQTEEGHIGGDLAFSPLDGYLYIPTGDGLINGDPDGRAQDLSLLFGKILRLDVSGETPVIPPDNPFVDTPGARPEIWAYGLRQPWRFSFDRLTGDMYLGDVGYLALEEINYEPAGSSGGANYGWPCYEGDSYIGLPGCANISNYTPPIYVYSHLDLGNCAVIGGFVYRGALFPIMAGSYLFADYCNGRVNRIYRDEFDQLHINEVGILPFNPVAFGENADGELFLADRATGQIHQLIIP